MMNSIGHWFKQRWRLLLAVLTPLILLPIPIIGHSSRARCGYIVLILIIYWVFEAIPLPVTSLLPLVLFPMAGILKAKDVAPHYFQDIITLFFGSMSLAYAIESVNLHRRITLFVLSIVGTSTKWFMAGIMAVTAFLSMWISNSAVTSIMLPVALAITDELENHGKDCTKEATAVANEVLDLTKLEFTNESTAKEGSLDSLHTSVLKSNRLMLTTLHLKQCQQTKKIFLLAVAYAAAIGGLATLVGTAPNIFATSQYKNTDFRINFLNFLLFAFPVALLMLILCWLWLQIYYNAKELFHRRIDPEARAAQNDLKAMLIKQYNDLGKPNWNEVSVAIIFIFMIILFVTRDFSGTPGWGSIFHAKYISDGTVAILCGILPLILPNANPFQNDWTYQPIIPWNNLAKNMPWGALLLLGAGLTIASAFQVSKLSESVARALRFLESIPHTGVILLVIIISGVFTEFTSNLSTASIFFPVLDSLARSSRIHPGYLILPCTLGVNVSFMLPIATPPNAIIFASVSIRVIDMVKSGFVMNIIGFLVVFLAAITWMPKIYGLNDRATDIFYNFNTTLINPGLYNATG